MRHVKSILLSKDMVVNGEDIVVFILSDGTRINIQVRDILEVFGINDTGE